MQEKTKTQESPVATVSPNFPLSSVKAPFVVPCTYTLTNSTGIPSGSVTIPEILARCAKQEKENKTKNRMLAKGFPLMHFLVNYYY
jgi:hypothetical protein